MWGEIGALLAFLLKGGHAAFLLAGGLLHSSVSWLSDWLAPLAGWLVGRLVVRMIARLMRVAWC